MGDYFGDDSLIPNAVNGIQVVMTRRCSVATLDKGHFDSILKASVIKRIGQKYVDIMDNNGFVILDVRLPAEYKFGHALNSINIPINALKQRISALNKNVMVYLSEESCERGELSAHILQQADYREFVIGRRHHFNVASHEKQA